MELNYTIPSDIVKTTVMNHLKIIFARVCASACCNLSQITDIITLCFLQILILHFRIIEKDVNSSMCIKSAMKDRVPTAVDTTNFMSRTYITH
jgi:hypothetical protein